MKRKIYVNICLLSILTILLTTILTLIVCYQQFDNQIKTDVKNEANLMAHQLNEDENIDSLASVSNIAKRITLVASDGTVIFDNAADISAMENHNDRPEILSAKRSSFGEIVRLSDTLKENTFYYAVLLNNGMVLRVARTTDSIFSVFIGIIPIILFVTLIIMIFSLFVAGKLTKNIIHPINQINLDGIDEEKIYDELLPFIKRISEQNKKINLHIEQLKAQKVRLNTISENMNEGLIVLDSASMVLSINNSALKIFRLAEADVIHKNFLHLTRDLEIIDYIKTALSGGNGTKTVYLNNTPYEMFYSSVFEKNTVYGAMLLFFDISEKAKAEQIRREFSANVSHELKTPLTTILGYSQMINNDMAKSEDIKSFTLKIEKEAGRMISLIEDIIKLSKLDEQDCLKDIQRVNLFHIAKDVIASLEQQIEGKNIKVQIDGNDMLVDGNQSMLQELIFNICDNAVKYNVDNGNITILIGDNKISVSDTGIGISKENQNRIFERFYQVDTSHSKKVSGTGLGLSIVKHIALFHNAEITVESELGKGTKITVDFSENGVCI